MIMTMPSELQVFLKDSLEGTGSLNSPEKIINCFNKYNGIFSALVLKKEVHFEDFSEFDGDKAELAVFVDTKNTPTTPRTLEELEKLLGYNIANITIETRYYIQTTDGRILTSDGIPGDSVLTVERRILTPEGVEEEPTTFTLETERILGPSELAKMGIGINIGEVRDSVFGVIGDLYETHVIVHEDLPLGPREIEVDYSRV